MIRKLDLDSIVDDVFPFSINREDHKPFLLYNMIKQKYIVRFLSMILRFKHHDSTQNRSIITNVDHGTSDLQCILLHDTPDQGI